MKFMDVSITVVYIYVCDLNVKAHKNIGCICKNCMFSYTNKHDIKSFITV